MLERTADIRQLRERLFDFRVQLAGGNRKNISMKGGMRDLRKGKFWCGQWRSRGPAFPGGQDSLSRFEVYRLGILTRTEFLNVRV